MANDTIEFSEVVDTTHVDSNITNAVKRVNIEMNDVNGIITNGDGTKVLSNDGTYKTIDSNAYLVDGSRAITHPFAGGNQVFKNAANAVETNDLTTLGQVEAKIEIGVYNKASRLNN